MSVAIPHLNNDGGMTQYIAQIRRLPMLTAEEEFMLAKRYQDHGDKQAAHRLVLSHLKLVVKIAMRYRGYGLPISDVVSEGSVGLMQAVKRFDPDKGFRLATYAMWWVKASIQEYVLRSWSLVRIGTTASQKKLFFNLRRAKARISAIEEGDLHPNNVSKIAESLGVSASEVVDMNRRLGGDSSLNAPLQEDGFVEWQDSLIDDSDNQELFLVTSEEKNIRHEALVRAIEVLNPREQQIFAARRLMDDPMTLEELSEKFGVSRERIRQIEARAFEKVQEAVMRNVSQN